MTAGRTAPSRYGAVIGTRGVARATDQTVVIAPAVDAPAAPARQALDGLPSVQRRMLVLRWSHGMAVHEIAALDAVPVDVVERRLVHGALAFAHLLGLPSGVTSPGVVAAREIAALGPRAELSPAGGRAPVRIPISASGPVVGPRPATTPPLDEPRDRRLPIAAACLAAASAAALGVAAATANVDATGSGASTGPGPGPAPGLGAVIPGPGALGGGPAAPAPVVGGTGDLGLPGNASAAPDGSVPPSLAAASAPAPVGALGVVPGGSGPVGVGPGAGGAPVGGGGTSPASTSHSSSTSSPSSSSPDSPAPTSPSAPSSSADPAPSSSSAESTRNDPPPRAHASSGGRGGDRGDRDEAGRDRGRGGERGDRGGERGGGR
ncbi:hypothetical protein ACFPK1_01855 [Actinomycetospora rhizophila]|uniref:RNA polymerase sigma factor 70 region 4 type 2 domain-containing protein n=1 Tax=Actinomycetospora rhizophila TaxID=1416876 RepID=A0ABV9ZBW6_9PSEU